MKTLEPSSVRQPVSPSARIGVRAVSTVAAAILGIAAFLPDVAAREDTFDDEDTEILTRGPVHEAFASVVDYNPSRGFVAHRPPPDPIEEIPPDERPDGDNVVWIPGYWAWDDELSDFIWVSGIWRDPPPGREWIAGYWSDDSGDYLWISGYWADIESNQTTYLPPPPKSLESGPNVDAPSDDYAWMPGCWVWYHDDYAWRPGYWARCRADWVWIPSHYVWTPRGYVFIEGYWDYTTVRRGIVYAPVRFHSRIYSRRGWHYSPRICFNLGLFVDYLFLRPSFSHYYFGDYYGSRYESEGFYVTFSYYYGWRGYDPFYAHRRWEHRRDRDWERNFQASYRYRLENETARPPDTWSAQVKLTTSTTSTRNRVIVAGTTTQVTSTKDFSVKLRKVDNSERERFANRAHDVRETRERRRDIEIQSVASTRTNGGPPTRPVKLDRPKSPIAARAIAESRGRSAPPKLQKAPEPDMQRPQAGRDGRETGRERAAGQPPRKAGPETRGNDDARRNSGNAATVEDQRKAGQAKQAQEAARNRRDQQEADKRARQAEAQAKRDQGNAEKANAEKLRAREKSEQKAAEAQQRRDQRENERKSQQQAAKQAAERERAEKARANEKAEQKAVETQQRREKQESDRKAKQKEAKAREDAEVQAARQAAERQRAEKARAKEESNKQAIQARQQKQQQAAEQRAAEERAKAEQAKARNDERVRKEKAKPQRDNGSGKSKDKKGDDEESDQKNPGNGRG